MRTTLVSIVATAALSGLLGDAAAAAFQEPAAQSAPSLPPDEAEVWHLLLPAKDAGTPEVSAIATKIARNGRASVGPVIAILMGESVEPDVAYTIDPRAIEMRERILVEALRRLPPNDVIDGLRSRITERTSVDVRVLVIRTLAEIGGRRAFDGLMGIAMSMDPIQWERTFVQVPIQDSLVMIVAKTPRLVRRLEELLGEVPAGFAPIVARALATARVPTALRALPACMGRDTALDLCALQELAKIAARIDPGADAEATKRIRVLLDSPDGDVQRAAATLLARMGDVESCPALVAKLSSDDPLTVGVARWSLETLSGKKLGPAPDAWTEWLSQQAEWLDETLPKLSEQLAAADPKQILTAIDELQKHKFHRHEVASALHRLLALEDPAAQRLACETLARIGSPRAIPWLVEKLDSPHEAVRHAAWTSLRELTHTDLPPDTLAWRVALAP